MKVAPRLLLALLATVSAAGCRTAGMGSLSSRNPTHTPEPRLSFNIDEFVADHNRNSRRIKSLEARPSITVTKSLRLTSRSGQVDGRLAFERPRNFKLDLSHFKSTVADIGSNDERFWFWIQNQEDKSVYVCNYADLASTSLAATYQPDWIVEALGLKEITPDEAAQVKVRPGSERGTTALIFPPTRSSGQTYSRVMIVSDLTRRISEYRIFAGDGKTLLAQASIKKYHDVPLDEESERAGTSDATVYLPENVVLDWKREQFSLDVTLKDVKVNQFNPERRAVLFVEPTPEGYARRNLAELTRTKAPEEQTSIRETIPPPEPRGKVRLGAPLEIRGSDSTSSTVRQGRTPDGTSSALPSVVPAIEEVVGAPVPTAPRSELERLSNAGFTASSFRMER